MSSDSYSDSGSPPQVLEAEEKKKRCTIACGACQRSHLSCDSGRPCSRCVDRGLGHLCRDAERKPRGRKRKEALSNSTAFAAEQPQLPHSRKPQSESPPKKRAEDQMNHFVFHPQMHSQHQPPADFFPSHPEPFQQQPWDAPQGNFGHNYPQHNHTLSQYGNMVTTMEHLHMSHHQHHSHYNLGAEHGGIPMLGGPSGMVVPPFPHNDHAFPQAVEYPHFHLNQHPPQEDYDWGFNDDGYTPEMHAKRRASDDAVANLSYKTRPHAGSSPAILGHRNHYIKEQPIRAEQQPQQLFWDNSFSNQGQFHPQVLPTPPPNYHHPSPMMNHNQMPINMANQFEPSMLDRKEVLRIPALAPLETTSTTSSDAELTPHKEMPPPQWTFFVQQQQHQQHQLQLNVPTVSPRGRSLTPPPQMQPLPQQQPGPMFQQQNGPMQPQFPPVRPQQQQQMSRYSPPGMEGFQPHMQHPGQH